MNDDEASRWIKIVGLFVVWLVGCAFIASLDREARLWVLCVILGIFTYLIHVIRTNDTHKPGIALSFFYALIVTLVLLLPIGLLDGGGSGSAPDCPYGQPC